MFSQMLKSCDYRNFLQLR